MEVSNPPLGNGYPFLVNIRIRLVQSAKKGIHHNDALFHWERDSLLNNVLSITSRTYISYIKSSHVVTAGIRPMIL
jgi:hypothetical protein